MKKLAVGEYRGFSIYLRGEDEYYVPAANRIRYYRTLAAVKRAIDRSIKSEKSGK